MAFLALFVTASWQSSPSFCCKHAPERKNSAASYEKPLPLKVIMFVDPLWKPSIYSIRNWISALYQNKIFCLKKRSTWFILFCSNFPQCIFSNSPVFGLYKQDVNMPVLLESLLIAFEWTTLVHEKGSTCHQRKECRRPELSNLAWNSCIHLPHSSLSSWPNSAMSEKHLGFLSFATFSPRILDSSPVLPYVLLIPLIYLFIADSFMETAVSFSFTWLGMALKIGRKCSLPPSIKTAVPLPLHKAPS